MQATLSFSKNCIIWSSLIQPGCNLSHHKYGNRFSCWREEERKNHCQYSQHTKQATGPAQWPLLHLVIREKGKNWKKILLWWSTVDLISIYISINRINIQPSIFFLPEITQKSTKSICFIWNEKLDFLLGSEDHLCNSAMHLRSMECWEFSSLPGGAGGLHEE